MAEHDQDDLDLDPELRALLGELDYEDSGPPPGLRTRTLDAVRAQPVPGQATERRRAAARERRRLGRPAILGGAVGLAAAVAIALVVVLGSGGPGDPDRTLTLAGADGSVTVEIRGDEATLRGDGAQLPAGTEYELWTITGESDDPTLTSAGTFRPGDDGTVDAELTLPDGTPDDAPLAVTREDDDDPEPNLPPVLAAQA